MLSIMEPPPREWSSLSLLSSFRSFSFPLMALRLRPSAADRSERRSPPVGASSSFFAFRSLFLSLALFSPAFDAPPAERGSGYLWVETSTSLCLCLCLSLSPSLPPSPAFLMASIRLALPSFSLGTPSGVPFSPSSPSSSSPSLLSSPAEGPVGGGRVTAGGGGGGGGGASVWEGGKEGGREGRNEQKMTLVYSSSSSHFTHTHTTHPMPSH